MSNKTIVQADDSGTYLLPDITSDDITRVDVVDVDIIIHTKNGNEITLPDAGFVSMSNNPPQVIFKDKIILTDSLFERVGTTLQSVNSNAILTSSEVAPSTTSITQEEVEKAIEKAVKEAKEEIEKEQKKHDSEESSQTSSLSTNTETSVEQMVEKAQKIIENLHTNDYGYVPPHEFTPPPSAAASPPGVPAPISLTPITTLFMGNVVGTSYDTTTSPGTTIIYGGGGAAGSESVTQIGARNALQFSPATITGTAGNDLIYAQGPAVGNPNPAVSTANYAKEFTLNVAGYFTKLNDIVFSDVPSGLTIVGATNNGGGSWTLPADYAIKQNAFTIIYDALSATGSFDITVDVTGQSTRGSEFHSQKNFRFQYLNVTNVNQVTDPTLVYEYKGRLQEIYILPTQDQPNIITLNTGTDTVYGGRNADTITGGDGDKTVYAREGDDNVTLGNGNNNIDLGSGNNTATTGTGNDTIIFSTGNNIISAGDGNNNITGTSGVNTITTGNGNDAVTIASGSGTINVSDGDNNVTITNGNYTIVAGSGNDILVGGSGDEIFYAGLGTNSITGGGGNNTLNYSDITTTAITASLLAGTTTGTSLSDTFTGITTLIGTSLADNITGSTTSEILYGNAGDDTITSGGGNDTIYGDSGNDTLTGNTGNDTIYGGSGNNIISGGASGVDMLYGGTGNDTFISPHSGTTYSGTDGATLASGEINTINYSTETVALTINLQTGFGSGGKADNSIYEFTSLNGYNSINGIIGGSGSDTITGSNSDDTINGGIGSDNLIGGGGTNILTGGAGGGIDTYRGGSGNDTIIGSTNTTDRLLYLNSPSGVVVNLSNSAQNFVNSLGVTRTVAAFSGYNFGVNSNDANSYSNGDSYTVLSGTNTSIDEVQGSSFADLIFSGSDFLTYHNTHGGNDVFYAGTGGASFLGYENNDSFYGNSGNDHYFFSRGNDRADGGTGFNVIRTNSFYASDYNVTLYLDAFADTNANGIADYIDRGVPSLVSGGITYTGFEYGWGNSTSGAISTLIKNFDNVIGNTTNEYLVGNNNANQINARSGVNTIYGMGGNDTITAIEGINNIDGGSGTDLVNFQFTNNAISGSLASNSPNFTYGVQVFLADGAFLGASDKTSYWGSGFSIYQARTGPTGGNSYNTITNIENINGSDYNDVLYGSSSANTIYGNNGDDIIAGNGGADSLYGGANNDTFRVLASDVASVVVFDGSTGTDILYSPAFTFSSGSISNSKYVSIETVDVRDSVAGGSYSLSSTDIQNFADNGTSSTVNLKLDNGDSFTASGFSSTSGSGADFTYRYYAEAGLINQIALLNVHYGVG